MAANASAFARHVLSCITRDHAFAIDVEHGSLERGPNRTTFSGSMPKRPGAGRYGMRGMWVGCVAAILAMVSARGGTSESVHTAMYWAAVVAALAAVANILIGLMLMRDRHSARVSAVESNDGSVQNKAMAALREGGFAGPAWFVGAHGVSAELRTRAKSLDVRCFEVDGDRLRELPLV